MRPKGKLFALLALFAAIGLITASGAFTTVSAERTADVNTAGDGSALLALEPHQSSANGAGQYAVNNTNNQLELQLTPDEGATGVNLNAVTEIELVFNITNQGNQEVDVSIIKQGANSEYVEFYAGTASSPFNNQIDNSSGVETLSPGDTAQISMKIDTTTASSLDGDEELLSDITINATTS